MNRRFHLLVLVSLCRFAGSEPLPTVVSDSFEGPHPGWEVVRGTWERKGGAYVQADNRPGAYRMSLAPGTMADGVIEVTATALAANAYAKGGCFGLVLRYVDERNWCALRLGEYGQACFLGRIDGKALPAGVVRITAFTPVVGQSYRLKADIRDARATVFIDDLCLAVVSLPFHAGPARVGLWAGSSARFDDFSVSQPRDPAAISRTKPVGDDTEEQVETENAGLKLAFTEWRPAPKTGNMVRLAGSLYLYVRNAGTTDATITDQAVLIDGHTLASLVEKGIVDWYRMRPAALAPGTTGELLIRMRTLFPENVARFLGDADEVDQGSLRVRLIPEQGPPLNATVPLLLAPPPLSVDFIAFNADLDRLFVYVRTAAKAGLRLKHCSVNGDVLSRGVRFGTKRPTGEVTPIQVKLRRPLVKGQATVVTVETKDGRSAGLTVRAFPSNFPIQVTLLGKQPREDAVRDIAAHCATSIGLCGRDTGQLSRAKALGLSLFPYGGTGGGWRERYISPEYPEIVGDWWDEMDRHPIRDVQAKLDQRMALQQRLGRPVPCTVNIMSPWTQQEFLELADAVTHEYGIDRGGFESNFRKHGDPAQSESRLASRPFWPYLRNAEIALFVDPDKKEVLRRAPRSQRCITPVEQRYITYRCLMRGAKGVLYWNYGAAESKANAWFDPAQTETMIRLSLGGVPPDTDVLHGYRVPDDVLSDLRSIWAEIGQLNAELRTLGPLIAKSTVCNGLVDIVRTVPEGTLGKEPAVLTATLIHGLDTAILLLVNNTIESTWCGEKTEGVTRCDPVDVTLDFSIPPWLKPRRIMQLDDTGLRRLSVKKRDGKLRFDVSQLKTTAVIGGGRLRRA